MTRVISPGLILTFVIGISAHLDAGLISDHSSQPGTKSSKSSVTKLSSGDSGLLLQTMSGTGHLTAFGSAEIGDSQANPSKTKSKAQGVQGAGGKKNRASPAPVFPIELPPLGIPPFVSDVPLWNGIPWGNEQFHPPGIVLTDSPVSHPDLPGNANLPSFLESSPEVEPVQNPEPSTALLFGLGALVLAGARCRKRRQP